MGHRLEICYDFTVPDTSRSNATYQLIRSDILTGKLQPGERLQVSALCQTYDVSSGVLREVLPRLVGEGLAKSEPQIGFSVISISIEDLVEITECRLTLETMALRQAIEHGDLSWEARVLAAHHVLTKTPVSTDEPGLPAEWITAHADFHRELLSGCPNERLCSVAASLRDLSDVYQHWSTRSEKRRDSAVEHQELLDASIGRDAELAVRHMTEHIQRTADYLVAKYSPATEREN